MYIGNAMMTAECCKLEASTRQQSDSPQWHNMRYGRITASILYEAARCKTAGTLVENIMGATPPLT